MRGVTQARNFRVGDYALNHTRTSGLDSFSHGPYKVLTVDELTITVRLERHGELAVHKNHARPSQPAGVIVLPYEAVHDVPFEEAVAGNEAVASVEAPTEPPEAVRPAGPAGRTHCLPETLSLQALRNRK